ILSPVPRDASYALRGRKCLRLRSRRLPLPAAVRAHGPMAELTDSARELHFPDHVQSC
ncbi:ZNF671 isoform 4, partial [Pongo abelii]